MSMPKVGGVGLALVLGFILTTVSVFTSGWINVNEKVTYAKITAGSVGIVPYHSYHATWFNVASWLMFISFAAYILVLLNYCFTAFKVHHHGCGHDIRHAFHSMSGLCTLIVIFEAVAFLLFAINASSYMGLNVLKVVGVSATLGYSAYLAIVSAVVTLIAGGLSAHVAHHHCC